MTRFSIESRDKIFANSYGFCILLKEQGNIYEKHKYKLKW